MSADILVNKPIAKARKWLNDAASTDWTEADLLDWYNDGVVAVRSERSDSVLEDDLTEIAYVAATTPGTDNMIFAEPERWSMTIAHYIAQQGFAQDAGDERDANRAGYHQEQFDRLIAGI